MDIDHTHSLKAAPLFCYQCSQPGHFSQNCPLCFDVRHMTFDKRDTMIEQLMADCDAAMAAIATIAVLTTNHNVAVAAITTTVVSRNISHSKVSGEDFVWYSG
jgi:hypothetical protein